MTASRNARKRSVTALGRALIVEDDPLLGMALEDALRDGGASEVRVCTTVADAMSALDDLKPEILILDVQLADRGDGWAMAELVTALSPRPPLIVFSTGKPDSIPDNVANLGVVLTKPYDPSRLIEVLTAHPRKPGLLKRLRKAMSREDASPEGLQQAS